MVKACCGAVLGAALLLATVPSAAMAQQGDADGPNNTYAGTYNGPAQPPSTLPFEANVGMGQTNVGFGAGDGAAGGGVSNSSNGQVNSIGTSTQAPGQICVLLPGTDIPYNCPQ